MKKIVVGVLTAVLLASAGCGAVQQDEQATCKVLDKDRTTNSEGHSEARVYTSCGTFKVADSLTRGKFTSADTFGRIQEGHTYKFTYHGWRNGFLSMFPNITEAEEVKKK